jgi:stearoyl-CoA desaturase (delta-9 desaturase)
MKLSKNTLWVNIPQHICFLAGLGLIFTGHASAWWLIATYVFWFIIGFNGFSIWYHRYFAHRAFKTSKFWESVWGYLGMLCGRGTPINMIGLHMVEHHPNSDTVKDPHSPIKGKFYSWVTWTEHHDFAATQVHPLLFRHIFSNKFVKWISLNYFKVFWGTFLILLCLQWELAIIVMMGAGVVQYHLEGFVSTFCHTPGFGVQDWDTKDNSQNIRGWFNLLTFGSGLHNNHHYAPKNYHYELLPGDFDLAKYIIPIFAIKEK